MLTIRSCFRADPGDLRAMMLRWFAPWGLLYRPLTWQAVLLLLMTTIFCVHIFLVVDHRSHSVSDTLYGVFPFVVPTLLVLERIASKTSGRPD